MTLDDLSKDVWGHARRAQGADGFATYPSRRSATVGMSRYVTDAVEIVHVQRPRAAYRRVERAMGQGTTH
jgi:hypothetical protein